MTKLQLIELVKRRLGNDGRFGDRTIGKNLALAWDHVMAQFFKKAPYVLDNYTKIYEDISITHNESTNEYYSTIPKAIVRTIDVNSGVRRINAMKDESLDFVPMKASDVAYVKNMEVGKVADEIGYYIQGNRVYYYNLDDTIEKVKMALVVSIDEYGDDDQLPFMEGTDLSIIGHTVEFLTGTPFVDPIFRRINKEEV